MRWTISRGIFVMLVSLLAGVGVAFLSPPEARAEQDVLRLNLPWPLDDEVPFLPRYCWARRQIQGKKLESLPGDIRAEVLQWQNFFGKNVFGHMHHYCAGLNRMRRYWLSVELEGKRVDESGNLTGGQRATLKAAIREFEYVQGYWKKWNKELYYEALVQKATAEWQLGEVQKALQELFEAIKVRSTYPQAYLLLSKIAEEKGDLKEAVEILELGLKQTNRAAALQSRLRELRAR